jgi:hypothetical protein
VIGHSFSLCQAANSAAVIGSINVAKTDLRNLNPSAFLY